MFRRSPRNAFQGKTAIVTGAASGIGRAIADELAARGADVVLADRQGDLAKEAARAIDARSGGRAHAEELDVRDREAFEDVVARTVARSGRVDFLFNNAGIAVGGEADGYAPEDWDDVFDVNLRGVANGVHAVYPKMIAQRSGHIVNTASVLGLVAIPGQASYTATKHAVVGMSKVLRVEAKTHGVNVSVLCPGAVWTPILSGGRFGHPGYENLRDETIRKMWTQLRPLTPEAFAARALDAVERNEGVIVVPRWWKALWIADRLAPTALMHVYGMVLDRTRRDLAAEGVVRARRGTHERREAEGSAPRRSMAN